MCARAYGTHKSVLAFFLASFLAIELRATGLYWFSNLSLTPTPFTQIIFGKIVFYGKI